MYCSQIEFGTPAYDEMVKLRYLVLREPLGLDFKAEDLAKEYADMHLAAYDQSGKLIGCLILTQIDVKTLKMRQVAINPGLQGQGVGSLLVKYSELFAQTKGYKELKLNARDTAVSFYEKLDYKKVGKKFMEVNIPHFAMIKKLN